MPTASLEETLNLFDPQCPLEMNELSAYYVARPHAPLEPMKTYPRVTEEPRFAAAGAGRYSGSAGVRAASCCSPADDRGHANAGRSAAVAGKVGTASEAAQKPQDKSR